MKLLALGVSGRVEGGRVDEEIGDLKGEQKAESEMAIPHGPCWWLERLCGPVKDKATKPSFTTMTLEEPGRVYLTSSECSWKDEGIS